MPAGPDSDVAAKLFLMVFEDAPGPGPQLSNRVFLIPEQRDLHILDGEFRLKPISKPRGMAGRDYGLSCVP
jgi:hypothetical protein